MSVTMQGYSRLQAVKLITRQGISKLNLSILPDVLIYDFGLTRCEDRNNLKPDIGNIPGIFTYL